jgi:putative endonuclease
MYYVYGLKSVVNGDLYIGYTEDLKKRFKQHNNGQSASTAPNRLWILVYYEAHRDKFEATKREKQLKMHRAKEDLRIQINGSLKII